MPAILFSGIYQKLAYFFKMSHDHTVCKDKNVDIIWVFIDKW